MLTSLFQDQGFNVVELESRLMLHGPALCGQNTSSSSGNRIDNHSPFSESNPIIEEEPGPPFIHIDRGAFAGSLRDSKNQKNVLTL
jgi:hypothetical protein